MTFRGKVQDRAQATAREVILYIEQWITSADVVIIPIHHARLSVNNTCVVLLASLDDLECLGYLRITTEPLFTTMISNIDTSIPPSTTAPDDLEFPTSTISDIDTSTPPSTTAHPEFPTTTFSESNVSILPSTTALDVMGKTSSTAVISPQSHSDAGAIVGGAVAIMFIITVGVVTIFLSQKYLQSTK